jgi:DNA-binding NtrC family response regulator
MRPKKKILLACANEDHAGVLKYILETNGYAVTCAATATLTLHLAANRPYELLLIEYPLDGLSHLLDQARALDSSLHSLVLAPKLAERPSNLLADVVLLRNTCAAELLERIKVLTARKRGPEVDRMVALGRTDREDGMTAYAQELRRCQVVLLLRAVIAAGGNQCAAARTLGVHRNHINRTLRAAGYDMDSLKRLAKAPQRRTRRKPPASAPAIAKERKLA